jgi:hypothetical protein
MMKSSTAERLMLREMILARGFQPKIFKRLRIILCTIISISALRGVSHIRRTEPPSFLSGRWIHYFQQVIRSVQNSNVIWSPEIAEDIYQHAIFSSKL